jgi:DNA-binding MarR family transcriptional regulator
VASQTQDATNVEQDVYGALSKVFLLLDDCDRRFFAEHGLSTRQFWALHHLDEEIGRPMMDLSRLLFTDKGNVTGIVDRLETLGLVTRSPSPNDRRTTLIRLTADGQRARDRINVLHETRVSELLGSVEHQRLELLLDLLSVVGANLESYLARYTDHAPTSANGNGAHA